MTGAGVGVFISYRRADPGAGYASGWLYERLVRQFGQQRVFKDVDSIDPGDNFVDKITGELSRCEALLAVIGPGWITVTDTKGQRRLDDPGDFVRLEIETALSRHIRVIPVLVEGADMPGPSQLPDSLKELAACNAFEVRQAYFGSDVDPLLKYLGTLVEPSAPPSAPPSAQPPPEDPVGMIADELAGIVREQWENETGLRLFHRDVQLLHVSWRPATEGFEPWPDLIRTANERLAGDQAAAASSRWAQGPADLAGTDYHDIAAVFGRVPTGRLVVLGEPGTGKTMLLIRLLQDLIRARDPGDAVPVIVSLASWRPAEKDLHPWLRQRLSIDYPYLRTPMPGQKGRKKISRGRALLDRHKILLILDGLDEIPPEQRPEAIEKINYVLDEHPEGVVIASRRQDYLDAARPGDDQPGRRAMLVHAAAGIVLQPLQPEEVASYLRRGAHHDRRLEEAWEPVLAQLGPDTVVGEVLTTALNVTLAHAIYNNAGLRKQAGVVVSPADLLNYPTPRSLKEHLYGTFIKAAYRPEGQEKPPPQLKDAERWLTFLAQNPGLAWWELRECASSWFVPTMIGLVCGIATAIAGVTGAHAGVGIGMGLGGGMIVGLALGLPFRRVRLPSWRPRPGGTGQARESTPLMGVCGGFVGGLASGVAAGLAASMGFGHTASPVSGLPVALGVGLGVGASTTFLGGLVGGAAGGFVAASLEGVGTGVPAGIANGLGIALIVAVIVKFVGRNTPAARRHWSRPIGLAGGLIIGGAVGVIAGVKESPMIGLILGAAVGAAAAWPVGLIGDQADENDIASPVAALSRDARAFWTTALAAGGAAAAFAFVGDGLASIFEVKAKFSFGLLFTDGIGVGISAGIVVGLAFGMYHATSLSFLITRVWLRLHAELPGDLMAFLVDAHKERGVLRQNGAVYEFRHAEIRDYLAARARESAAAKRKPPRAARAYAWRPRELRSPA